MPKYVIRFTEDGRYNEGDGFPVPLAQATVYESRVEAEAKQRELFDSEVVELPEEPPSMTPEQLDSLEKWLDKNWPPGKDYPDQTSYIVDAGRHIPIGYGLADDLYRWCCQTRQLIAEVRRLQGVQNDRRDTTQA